MRGSPLRLTSLAAVAACIVIAGIALNCSRDSAPHNLADFVPLDTKLSELDRHLERRSPSSTADYVEWIPYEGNERGSNIIENEYGVFRREHPKNYDAWTATKEERDRFTGEITVIHHGSTSADVNSFVYIKGRLKKKDWGFLPG